MAPDGMLRSWEELRNRIKGAVPPYEGIETLKPHQQEAVELKAMIVALEMEQDRLQFTLNQLEFDITEVFGDTVPAYPEPISRASEPTPFDPVVKN